MNGSPTKHGSAERLEPIRLVIWDLDDTFWRGTLSEAGIEAHSTIAERTLIALAQRGIVSSICSKNDLDAVRTVLMERKLWHYFVFPSINWTGKGARVRDIVEAVRLRPPSVLFIDDNSYNRAEVAAALPGIQVADEHAIEHLLADPRLRGADDPDLSRLQHYRLIEVRHRERGKASDKGDAFLRSSAIRVEIDHDVEANIDRVVELLNRTNQLNFTKQRLSEDPAVARTELREQLHATSGRRAGLVRVSDRFGSHGIVGFWMMDGIWVKPYLLHFAFSCRVMGMGIERWVYDRLDRPQLDIIGEVAADLEPAPDWINRPDVTGSVIAPASTPAAVRLRGGCELEVVRHFFAFSSTSVSGEFVHPRGGQVVWTSHVATLFTQPTAATRNGAAALARIGLLAEYLESDFLRPVSQPTCLVLSLSGDTQVPLYRHRTLDLVVPIKLFGLNLPVRRGAIARYCAANGLTGDEARRFRDGLAALRKEWEPVPFSQTVLDVYYRRLADTIPDGALLVLILPLTFTVAPDGRAIHYPEQALANDRLRHLAAGRSEIAIVDAADCLTSRNELRRFSHLHFARDVYHRLFEQISLAYAGNVPAGALPSSCAKG